LKFVSGIVDCLEHLLTPRSHNIKNAIAFTQNKRSTQKMTGCS